MATAKVTISPTGQKKIEVIGGQGKSCLVEFEKFSSMLGDLEARELKPEFYKTTRQKQAVPQT